jgi:WD40 repeat protein/serine/threonine protein kinase
MSAENEASDTVGRGVPAEPQAPSGCARESAAESTVVLESITEKAGDKIGRYKLLQKIGEGGYGVVYMADQEEPIRRRVALKIIKLGMDTRAVIARFEAERQALAMMDHPNIAKVLDAGATDTGRPYFVMELVRGVRITDYCDQNKLGARQRLALFMQVCQAIQHAHQKGIIHRDIKPSNVLLTLHDGVPVPKVIDFGIAKATEARLTDKTMFTAFEQIIGTPAYMSPEQAEMSGLDIDTRTDIYSLGVVLYELLTGQTPFDAEQLLRSGVDEMRRKIREDEPKRPSTRLSTMAMAEAVTVAKSHGAQIPALVKIVRGDLDWIVMKCLEKDRTRRYETANGLAMDIQRYLNNEPIVARPPSKVYRLQKLVRRNKAAFASAAVVAIALVLGFAISTRLFLLERAAHRRAEAAEREQNRLRQEAERAQQTEAGLRAIAEEERRRAESRLYVSDMNLVNQAIANGNFARARQLLAAHRDHQPDLRGFEWRYLWTQSRGQHVQEFTGHDSPLIEVTWSADGNFLASRSQDLVLKVWDLAAGKERASIENVNSIGGFTPDRGAILYSKDDSMLRFHFGRNDHSVLATNVGILLGILGDGQTVASTATNFAVKLWDLATGRQKLELPGRGGVFHGIVHLLAVNIALNGDTAAVLHTGGFRRPFVATIDIWDVRQARLLTSLSDNRETHFTAFSPDGLLFASGGAHGIVKLWNLTSPAEPRTLKVHDVTVRSMAFSPDGRLFATGSSDQSIKLWDRATGTNLLTFRGHEDRVRPVVFSPDGTRLASGSADGTVKLWNPAAVPESQVLDFALHSFSPNTKLVAGFFRTNMMVWDFATHQVRLVLSSRVQGPLGFTSDNKYFLKLRVDLDSSPVSWMVESHDLASRALHAAVSLQEPPPNLSSISMAFAPGQGLLALSEQSSLKLWDVFTGTKVAGINQPGPVTSLLFSPDEQLLVGLTAPDEGKQGKLRFFNARSLAQLDFVPSSATWSQMAFSPDGNILAVSGIQEHGGAKGSFIQLWDVRTRQEIATLGGHRQAATGVCFSPDGHLIATGSSDGTIKLWNVALRQEVATLKFNDNPAEATDNRVARLVFSPDGNTLVAISSSGETRYFRAATWPEIHAETQTSRQ